MQNQVEDSDCLLVKTEGNNTRIIKKGRVRIEEKGGTGQAHKKL